MRLTLVAAAVAAAAPGIDTDAFRWARELSAARGGFVAFEPDGPLRAHARADLADLRVRDARGRQVPWRLLPAPAPRASKEALLLNAGREGRAFVALLDVGRPRAIRNRAELLFGEEREFVGRVTVFGSDDRRAFTRLSTTTVFHLRGARSARSTTLVFPPTDHRFLRLRGPRLPSPVAVRVYNAPRRPTFAPVPAEEAVDPRERATEVTLDLRFRNTPVDRLRFRTSTTRFDRAVEVAESNGGRFVPIAGGRIVRLGGVVQVEIPVQARARRLRVTIRNGDDAPLRALSVAPLARPRPVVLDNGYDAPFRILYGNRSAAPPEYDFAGLPPRELRPVVGGTLGAERRNPAFRPPEDTRSLLERNPRLVEVALAAIAVGLGIAGFLALRRRA